MLGRSIGTGADASGELRKEEMESVSCTLRYLIERENQRFTTSEYGG
jgi:hypothetical protein